MDEEKPRKTTPFGRSARNRRIVERLREGFGFHEIAREEKLSERRVRQIVKQALEGREALESAIHAHMQIDRLGQAMRVAGDALARGDVRAVAPFIKAVEKLDRYQSLAREVAPKRRNMSDGDTLVMQTLVARIRRQVLDECRREAAQAVAAVPLRPLPRRTRTRPLRRRRPPNFSPLCWPRRRRLPPTPPLRSPTSTPSAHGGHGRADAPRESPSPARNCAKSLRNLRSWRKFIEII